MAALEGVRGLTALEISSNSTRAQEMALELLCNRMQIYEPSRERAVKELGWGDHPGDVAFRFGQQLHAIKA